MFGHLLSPLRRSRQPSNWEPKKDIDSILADLESSKEIVRETAIGSLLFYTGSEGGDLKFEDITTKEILREWLTARDQSLQEPRIAQAIAAAFDDPSPRVRNLAAQLLSPSSPNALDIIVGHLLTDSDQLVRMMSAITLSRFPNSEPKRDAMTEALTDPFYRVACIACRSLGRMGNAKSIEPLYGMLGHSHWRVRFKACEALIELGQFSSKVVAMLEEINRLPEAIEHDQSLKSASDNPAALPLDDSRNATTQEVLQLALTGKRHPSLPEVLELRCPGFLYD